MVICNREKVKDAEYDELSPSDYDCKPRCCPNDNYAKGDIQDILTWLHPGGWGEITDFENCDGDITIVDDQEALWQAVIGEIKTPLGVIPSVHQENYGCQIWDLLGEPMSGFFYQDFNFYIEQMCKKYPEINSIVELKLRQGNKGSLSMELTLDTIYGTFTGEERLEWHGSF